MNRTSQRKCTACDEHTKKIGCRCRKTFTCVICGRRRNRCCYLPGGLDAKTRECIDCHHVRVFGAAWVAKWSQHEDTYNRRPRRKSATERSTSA